MIYILWKKIPFLLLSFSRLNIRNTFKVSLGREEESRTSERRRLQDTNPRSFVGVRPSGLKRQAPFVIVYAAANKNGQMEQQLLILKEGSACRGKGRWYLLTYSLTRTHWFPYFYSFLSLTMEKSLQAPFQSQKYLMLKRKKKKKEQQFDSFFPPKNLEENPRLSFLSISSAFWNKSRCSSVHITLSLPLKGAKILFGFLAPLDLTPEKETCWPSKRW